MYRFTNGQVFFNKEDAERAIKAGYKLKKVKNGKDKTKCETIKRTDKEPDKSDK